MILTDKELAELLDLASIIEKYPTPLLILSAIAIFVAAGYWKWKERKIRKEIWREGQLDMTPDGLEGIKIERWEDRKND